MRWIQSAAVGEPG